MFFSPTTIDLGFFKSTTVFRGRSKLKKTPKMLKQKFLGQICRTSAFGLQFPWCFKLYGFVIKNYKLTVKSSPNDITFEAFFNSGGNKRLHGAFPYSFMISHNSFISVHTLACASAPLYSVIEPGIGLAKQKTRFFKT